MPRKPRPTFSDYVAELKAAPERVVTGKAGHFAATGELLSVSGEPLTRSLSSITPAEALEFASSGAAVAFEGCGCGGTAGCPIRWFDEASVARLVAAGTPHFVKGFGSPTWFDLWSGTTQTLVFAHGDVRWSDVMG